MINNIKKILKGHNINKYLFITLIIIAIFSFILSITTGLNNDEFFSIGLVQHSYLSLIKIDALDVHPPLYYIILKLFLNITTFWTSSIFIKIIFARFLSLISFFITVFTLLKTLKILRISCNHTIQLILYFLYPSIATYSVTIRMYQMSIMLLAIEVYSLLKFHKDNQNKYLIASLITIILAFYTNYFSAAFAGALLITEFIDYTTHKELHNLLRIFLTGICSLITFIPGLHFCLIQAKYVSHKNYSNFVGVPKLGRSTYSQLLGAITGRPLMSIKSIIIDLILLIIFCTTIIYIKNNYSKLFKSLLYKLYGAFIIGFIPSIILSYISHPMIQWRYGFPIFAIIYFYLCCALSNWVITHKYDLLSLILILFMIPLNVKTLSGNIINDKQCTQQIRKVEEFKNSSKKDIFLNSSHKTCLTPLFYSVYSPKNLHKIIIVRNMRIKDILACNNKKLIRATFPNIKIKGKLGKANY